MLCYIQQSYSYEEFVVFLYNKKILDHKLKSKSV